jgi:Xaa-Pro aminopeptidase
VLSALDSIAWTFNVRGAGRRAHAGRPLLRAGPRDGTADLFVAPRSSATTSASISATACASRARAFEPHLASLAGKTVVADPERAVAAIFEALEGAGAKVSQKRDPAVLPRRSRTRRRSPATAPPRRATARR